MSIRYLGATDRKLAIQAKKEGRLQICWNPKNDISAGRKFAEDRGWNLHYQGFEAAFIIKMLENDENWTQVVQFSSIDVYVRE